MKFLIQKNNGELALDFCFHLVQAIKYQNWYAGETVYSFDFIEVITEDTESNCIPIGDLNFVKSYIEKIENKIMPRPIQIPQSLRTPYFLQREAYETNAVNALKNWNRRKVFVKDISKYKGEVDVISNEEDFRNFLLGKNEVFISEYIAEFTSETRVFVCRNQVRGIKNYAGDCYVLPSKSFIQDVIKHYENAPSSYTIDIGISDGKEMIIEIHPFVSCGLYGFDDYKILPQMLISGYYNLIR